MDPHHIGRVYDGLFEVPTTQSLADAINLAGDGCSSSDPLCFFKFEDSLGWDRMYGTIMGGGGKGIRNGWGLAHYDPDEGGTTDTTNLQDSMEKLRTVVQAKSGGTANNGWAIDDHPDTGRSPLCVGTSNALYRVGVLGSPTDVDVFSLDWPGGDLAVTWSAPDVSAALVKLSLYKDGVRVGDDRMAGAAPGAYDIHVESTGDYGALGYYRIDIL
jgi:hypothetical protein